MVRIGLEDASSNELSDTHNDGNMKDEVDEKPNIKEMNIKSTVAKTRRDKFKTTSQVGTVSKEVEDSDSDTPIASLFRNIHVMTETSDVFTQKCDFDLKNIVITNQVPLKQLSHRKRVMQTANTVLKCTTACPFRHHKSWFQCFFCLKEFMDIHTLRTHTRDCHLDMETEIKRLKRYPNSLQLEISYLKCRLCDLSLNGVTQMKEHFQSEHNKLIYNECIADYKINKSPYSCHICDQQFHMFRSLTTHLNEHYANFICDVCGKSFINTKRLKVHRRTHERGAYPCNQCGKILKSKMSKSNHMESAHFKRVLKCHLCFEPMKHYNDRIKHMSVAHNITHKFTCHICGREYNIKHYLATHMRQTHGHKDKKCADCGMAFITNHGLKKHMLKHTGEKPFICKVCCKSYSRNYTLREHMKIHEAVDKRFQCN